MVGNLDDFKSLISQKGGIARTNMFRVELPTLPGATKEQINLLCRDVNLPGRQITTRERTIGITTKPMAYGYLSQDVSMTFSVLNNYGVKEYFERWQNLAVNQTSKEIGYKREYSYPIKIQQLSRGIDLDTFNKSSGINIATRATERIVQSKVVYECELIDAFPTTINPISFNNELDGIVDLNVAFSYTNWTSNFTGNDPVEGGENGLGNAIKTVALSVLVGSLLNKLL